MWCTIAIASLCLAADDPVATSASPPVTNAADSTSAANSTSAADPTKPFKLDLAAPPAPLVISTDRPGFSNGTGIVPPGHANLENGFTYTTDEQDGFRVNSEIGPQMLLRVGLIEDLLEFRAGWSGYNWVQTRDDEGARENFDGWTDVFLGAKLKVLNQDGWIPRVAVLAQTTIGGGEEPIATQEIEPLVGLLLSYDLGSGYSVIGNANIAWPTTGGEHFTQGQVSAAFWFPIVDRVNGFVETYVLFPNSLDNDAAWYADFGATWLIQDRVQLDGSIGVGLNREANDFSASVGISFLF